MLLFVVLGCRPYEWRFKFSRCSFAIFALMLERQLGPAVCAPQQDPRRNGECIFVFSCAKFLTIDAPAGNCVVAGVQSHPSRTRKWL